METPAISSSPAAPVKSSRNWALAWLLVSQVTGLILTAIPLSVLVFAVALSGPSSLKIDRDTFMFFLPLLNLLPMIAAWIAFVRGKNRLALILTSLPLLAACAEVIWLASVMSTVFATPNW